MKNISEQQPLNIEQEQGIDLVSLVGVLWSRKLFILSITILFSLISIFYVLCATPIYEATAMIQVEESTPSLPGLDDMTGIFEENTKSITEIELLKSRKVIGEALDLLKLDIVAEPVFFPIIGGRMYRSHSSLNGVLSSFKLGANKYAWGGEDIEVFRLDLPVNLIEKKLILRVEGDDHISLFHKKNILVQGRVGEDIHDNNISLSIRRLSARTGTEFRLLRRDRFNTIIELQQKIRAVEKGKDSGIINLSYQHKNPDVARATLDCISRIYVRQNIERNSEEAQKSLDFLKVQLPGIKKELEKAEKKFNDYQIQNKSIDITLETQGILEQLIELDTKSQELELNRLEISRRFKKEHPLYRAVIEQIRLLSNEKEKLKSSITELPETQQELLRYTRDVEVSNEIYMMLLAKAQELDILRAGTVGNARIVDDAAVNLTEPVHPKKVLIIPIITLLGLLISSFIVVLKQVLNKSLQNIVDVESLGLPVYATIPISENIGKIKSSTKKNDNKVDLLVHDFPSDLAVEALRGLRTSLQFALHDAKNNIIVISGPSPEVGKSFISTNLSAVIAQSGKKVIVIDGDLRRGDLQEHFSMKQEIGLTGYLANRYQIDEIICETDYDGLSIIPRGIHAPNASELLMNERFKKLMNYTSENYDIVIIDTPPILAVTDPAIIASHAGTTLIIARHDKTYKREIELTKKYFLQNGVELKGLIFNGYKKNNGQYYYNTDYYNYSYTSN